MVIDERHTTLIQRAVDGELSAIERDELNVILSESSGAQELYGQLTRIAQLRDATPTVDAPGDLKSSVMRSIDPDRYRYITFGARLSRVLDLMSALWSRQLAFGLATGAVLGLGLSVVVDLGPLSEAERESTSGALVPAMVSVEPTRIFDQDIEADQVTGRLFVDRSGQLYSFQFNIESGIDATVELSYDSDSWVVRSIQQQGLRSMSASSSPGLVHIEHSGKNEYTITLEALNSSPDHVECMVITDRDVMMMRIEME